jgi:hypothetical protein
MVASAKSDEASKIRYARVLHLGRQLKQERQQKKCEKIARIFFLVKTAKKVQKAKEFVIKNRGK